MKKRTLWLMFVLLLMAWLAGVLSGRGGVLVHVLLVLAVATLGAGILHSQNA